MKLIIRRIFACLLALMVAVTLITGAVAESSVTYDGDAKKFIYSPGSNYSPNDLFDELKNVMPGDSLMETIKVYNAPSNNVKVNIYMRSLGASAGSEEFLSQLHLRVAKAEKNRMAYMFDAAADQSGQLGDWVLLGTLYSGGEVTLEVTLDVPITLGNEFQDAVGEIEWQFKVEAFPISPDDPVPPQTGDGSLMLWLACGGAVAVLGVILFVSKKRRYDEE